MISKKNANRKNNPFPSYESFFLRSFDYIILDFLFLSFPINVSRLDLYTHWTQTYLSEKASSLLPFVLLPFYGVKVAKWKRLFQCNYMGYEVMLMGLVKTPANRWRRDFWMIFQASTEALLFVDKSHRQLTLVGFFHGRNLEVAVCAFKLWDRKMIAAFMRVVILCKFTSHNRHRFLLKNLFRETKPKSGGKSCESFLACRRVIN